VKDKATLEWLPQDTILFSGCQIKTTTKVSLERNSRFVGWEIICLGRPASGEKFEQGHCRQNFEIWRESQPLLIERTVLEGGSEVLSARWGLAGYTVMGVMVVSNANKEILELARQVETKSPVLFSATLMGELLVCRILGQQGMQVRDHYIEVWKQIRKAVLDVEACPPRIWNT
jgi:urease accessory protein